jgi:hypothetical protein
MEEPLARRSRSTKVRGGLVAPVVFGLAVAAGCSSAGTGSGHVTPTANRAPTSGPSTTGPVGSATPPFRVAQATIEVSGSTATITFASRVVTRPLHVTGTAFNSGQRRLTFSITGVAYTGGAVSAAGSPGDLIAGVTLSGFPSGVTVHIDLHRAGTAHRFTVAGDRVGVSFS